MINFIKFGIVATNLFLIFAIASDLSTATAQTTNIELTASSIDSGGSAMSGDNLILESSVGQGQPVGTSSNATYSLDTGFIPLIAQEYSSQATPSTPTATPVTTATATPSANPTATPTATPVSTVTATPSANPTGTPTPTPTPTASVLEAPAISTVGLLVLFIGILAVMLFGFWVMNGNKKSKVV